MIADEGRLFRTLEFLTRDRRVCYRQVLPMGILVPFPESKTLPVQPLTKKEYDSVLATAYVLMQDEHALAVSSENDRRYMIVFDRRGEPYFIGRVEGVCCLCKGNETMLASSQQLEEVLETLKDILKEDHDGARASSTPPRSPSSVSAQ